MKEYKTQNCTVRVHGTYDPEAIRAATKNYLKKVVRSKKNEREKKKAQVESPR